MSDPNKRQEEILKQIYNKVQEIESLSRQRATEYFKWRDQDKYPWGVAENFRDAICPDHNYKMFLKENLYACKKGDNCDSAKGHITVVVNKFRELFKELDSLVSSLGIIKFESLEEMKKWIDNDPKNRYWKTISVPGLSKHYLIKNRSAESK